VCLRTIALALDSRNDVESCEKDECGYASGTLPACGACGKRMFMTQREDVFDWRMSRALSEAARACKLKEHDLTYLANRKSDPNGECGTSAADQSAPE
jgi:hypothetical protein